MSITFILLTLLFLAVSVAMILLILVQRPQGGGLAGAFGGAGGGGTDTAFGGRTGDALTLATVGAFTVFLLLAIVINVIGNPRAFADQTEPAIESAIGGDSSMVSPDLVDAPVDAVTPPIDVPAVEFTPAEPEPEPEPEPEIDPVTDQVPATDVPATRP